MKDITEEELVNEEKAFNAISKALGLATKMQNTIDAAKIVIDIADGWGAFADWDTDTEGYQALTRFRELTEEEA